MPAPGAAPGAVAFGVALAGAGAVGDMKRAISCISGGSPKEIGADFSSAFFMRVFAVWLVLCFALVARAVAQEPAPDSSPAPDEDRVPMLIGSWTCSGSNYSTSHMYFTRQHDGSIAGKILYHFAVREPGQQDEWNETYRFDRAANRWIYEWDFPETHLTTSLSGPEWSGDMWTLFGELFVHYYHEPGSDAIQQQLKRPMRLIYQATGNDTVQRDVQILDRGKWLQMFQSMCTRDH